MWGEYPRKRHEKERRREETEERPKRSCMNSVNIDLREKGL